MVPIIHPTNIRKENPIVKVPIVIILKNHNSDKEVNFWYPRTITGGMCYLC
jgi:hypothetical protein